MPRARSLLVALIVYLTATSAGSAHGLLAGKRVTIDPGHDGGNTAAFNASVPPAIAALVRAGVHLAVPSCDTSGTATRAGYSESAFNLDVALRLGSLLVARGATVTMTRRTNRGRGPCTSERAAIGNRAHADAAISIHADSGPASGRGFHVIEPGLLRGYTDDIVSASRRLGRAVHDAYRRGSGLPPSTYLGSDGYDVRTDLVGLVLSNAPKIFVETGNMANPTDARILERAAGRRRIALALADGLTRYLAR